MPELPEVETICRGVAPHLIGKTIQTSIVRQAKLRWPVDQKIFHLNNEQIINVYRRAKYLLMQVNSGYIIIHFGMSGSMRLLDLNISANKHDHIDLVLSSNKILRFSDPRRFGAWLWCHDPMQHRLLMNLGIEPLSDAFNPKQMFQATRNCSVAVKPWIMRGHIVVGVGNIYANEALYHAKISPFILVRELTYDQIVKLVKEIKRLLQEAIAKGGSTLRDFTNIHGSPGFFVQQLCVYGRPGKPCMRCGSHILGTKQAQRSTFYCAQCQN